MVEFYWILNILIPFYLVNRMDVPLEQAARLVYPRLTVLVTSVDSVGNVNAAPYSWVMPISFSPPMLVLGIQAKETRTIKNIRQTREFVVNVLTKGWAQKAVNCEKRGVDDKLHEFGLESGECSRVKAPCIKEAKIVLECELSEIIQPQNADHYIVVGGIVAARKDESLRDNEVVMHIGGQRFILPGQEIELNRGSEK
jgi:flavin reductase (DIM6/NTAB) family NADH-FMN oxidoreductase RutF